MNEIIEKIISHEAEIDCTIQIGGLAAKHRFVRYKSWMENDYIHIKEQNQSLDIPVRKLEEAVYEVRNGMLIGRMHLLDERSVSVTFCIKQNSASSMSGRTQMRRRLSANT
ncbi:MAG: hypothetical protein ACRDBO_02575 [Lachnospiraceae bacterium]